MIKIKKHIKIGNVYTLPEEWAMEHTNGEQGSFFLPTYSTIMILDFNDINLTACDATFLYDGKIYKRSYVGKNALNALIKIV